MSKRNRKARREIRLGVDYTEDKSVWRISAACPDEMTAVYLMGGADKLLPIPDETALRGEYGRMLVEDHHARCASCQRWGKSA